MMGQYLLCRHEYGEAALTLELVDSMDEAIDHIHAHGSGHTEAIITGACYKFDAVLVANCPVKGRRHHHWCGVLPPFFIQQGHAAV